MERELPIISRNTVAFNLSRKLFLQARLQAAVSNRGPRSLIPVTMLPYFTDKRPVGNRPPPTDLPAGYEVMGEKGLYGFLILKLELCSVNIK